MSQTLPDSGGAYMDADSGGLVAIARRNFGAATAEIKSGNAGAAAVGFITALVVVPGLRRGLKSAGLM